MLQQDRLARRVFSKLQSLVLGVHPNNSVFSFNWHNIRHINEFFETTCASIDDRPLVVADIGGGRSPYFPHFAGRLARYICVDLRSAFPAEEARGIVRVEGVAEHIPLADASVDVVLCNQVLEHVTDPVASVGEIHRILKVGGLFLGSAPHVSPVHLEPNDFRRFTDLGLRRLFDGCGFDEIGISGNGGVFSAAALAISMDVLLSRREEGVPQRFDNRLALAISPMVAALNLTGLVLDKLSADKRRTPANLCWRARKMPGTLGRSSAGRPAVRPVVR